MHNGPVYNIWIYNNKYSKIEGQDIIYVAIYCFIFKEIWYH